MVEPSPSSVAVSATSSQRAQRETEIIDTAAHLFARNGYSETGIAELCEAVGLGKGALYHYIGSKEKLLAQIHDRVMVDVLAGAEQAVRLDASASERLRLLGIELIRVITQYPDHVWVFLHDWRSLTGELAQDFRAKRKHYEKILETILQDGAETGEFEIDDLRLTALAWHNLHNFTYQWFRRGGEKSAFEIANRFYEIFTVGIRPRGT